MDYELIQAVGNERVYRVYLQNEPCDWVEFRFFDGEFPSWVVEDYAEGSIDPYATDADYDQAKAFRDRAQQACQRVFDSLLPAGYDKQNAAAHWQKVREMAERGSY